MPTTTVVAFQTPGVPGGFQPRLVRRDPRFRRFFLSAGIKGTDKKNMVSAKQLVEGCSLWYVIEHFAVKNEHLYLIYDFSGDFLSIANCYFTRW